MDFPTFAMYALRKAWCNWPSIHFSSTTEMTIGNAKNAEGAWKYKYK